MCKTNIKYTNMREDLLDMFKEVTIIPTEYKRSITEQSTTSRLLAAKKCISVIYALLCVDTHITTHNENGCLKEEYVDYLHCVKEFINTLNILNLPKEIELLDTWPPCKQLLYLRNLNRYLERCCGKYSFITHDITRFYHELLIGSMLVALSCNVSFMHGKLISLHLHSSSSKKDNLKIEEKELEEYNYILPDKKQKINVHDIVTDVTDKLNSIISWTLNVKNNCNRQCMNQILAFKTYLESSLDKLNTIYSQRISEQN